MARLKPKGSWKQSEEKRRRFIERALKKTMQPMHKIGKRAGVSLEVVSRINVQQPFQPPIRSRELTYKITGAASAKTRVAKRRKIRHFSKLAKEQLLEEHVRGIRQVANSWYWRRGHNSELLRRQYQTIDDLVNDIRAYVFEQLDYYDPEIKGKHGNQVKPFSYIYGGAELFCKFTASSLRGERRRKPPAQRTEEIWVPPVIMRLLKKIGKIPKLYHGAETVPQVIDKLRELIKKPEIGLTPRMRELMGHRLAGKGQKQIMHAMAISDSRMWRLENRATKKIREYFSK